MEVRKNFETFKSGDMVRVKKDFPYIDHTLFTDEIYTIDKMLSDAGIVTIVGKPWNKTFPDDAFEMVIDDRYYLNGDC